MVSRDAVAVVVVVRRHPGRLANVLAALANEVPPSGIIVANVSGTELSPPAGIAVVTLPETLALSDAVSRVIQSHPSDLLWIVRDDSLPRAGAFAALRAVFDTSPSAGIVGPKQLDADLPIEIREMGESISRSGFAVQLAEREMDQGQYDRQSDVLGVGEAGMLVRRSIWDELAGFDPALDVVDGALDFCYRARAAGWRIEIVPNAVIETLSSSLEAALGEVPVSRIVREEAKARAHRVLSYLPTIASPFRGVSLFCGAAARGFARFVRKQPNPFAELAGTVAGIVRIGTIAASRRSIARTATQPIDRARLFVTRTDMARRRSLERDDRRAALEGLDSEPRLGFGQLGLWMTAAAGLVGLTLGHNFVGAEALSGGALLPLPDSILAVWSSVGATWTPIAGGLDSAPDGFSVLIAALATLTWWDPNVALVGLWLLAVPLSFVAGWVGAGAVTIKSGTAFLVATIWTLMPSLHVALAEGRIGSVIAHIAIPLTIRALCGRGIVSGGWFALLAASVWVSVPALAPVIVLATVVRAVAGRPPIVLGLVPALALEWPRIIEAVMAAPLTYFADRGVPAAAVAPPMDVYHLWAVAPSIPLLDSAVAGIVVLALVIVSVVVTIVVVATGNARLGGIVSIASVGVLTLVVLTPLPLARIADQTVSIAPGAVLDPLWFALAMGIAVLATTSGIVRAIATPVTLASFAAVSLSTIALPFLGGTLVQASPIRSVPAYVEAETRTHPESGTLIITPREDALVAELQRGSGATLTEWTATAATRRELTSTEGDIATIAGNLIVESGFDIVPAASELNIRFVLLKADPTNPSVSAIASHAGLSQVGQTDTGVLWVVGGDAGSMSAHSGRNVVYVVGAALAVLVSLIAAIPTSLPRRRIGTDELVLTTGETDA